MKRFILLAIVLMIMLMIMPVAESIGGSFVRDTIHSPALAGNWIGDPDTRELTVYLPPSYPASRYPVLYLLHGFGGDNNFFVDTLTEAIALITLDGLMLGGVTPEMIIVMPDGSNHYGGSFYTNSPLTGNYEDYIVRDVVGHIDAKYRTIPERSSRLIMGASMGGYGAMKLGIKHPDLFSLILSLCAPLGFLERQEWFIQQILDENPNGMSSLEEAKTFTRFAYALSAAFSPNFDKPPLFIDLPFEYPSGKLIPEVWERWAEHDIITLFDSNPDLFTRVDGIYLDVGDNDELGLTPVVVAFHERLEAAGIDHEFFMFEGGHSDEPVTRLLKAMQFIGTHMVGPSNLRDTGKLSLIWADLKR